MSVIHQGDLAFERAANSGRIHSTDFRCIGYLKVIGKPASPGRILSYLGLSSGAGTALFDRLEKAGYIRRERNPEDRRSVLIVLDEIAAAEPLRLYAGVSMDYRAVMSGFSDSELAIVARYLEEVGRIGTAWSATPAP
ncbi:MAG: MarR family transcriptional regulator [Paracoccus sp. (in: a-proteobacteria)]|uniref:MarR family transcriptional regulator n=1 Tax=Paracoccus sp. TaxID=267 RepID=UPI0039E64B44